VRREAKLRMAGLHECIHQVAKTSIEGLRRRALCTSGRIQQYREHRQDRALRKSVLHRNLLLKVMAGRRSEKPAKSITNVFRYRMSIMKRAAIC
jgi:hypothetical protein